MRQRPGYQANLVSSLLPALDGVVERLEQGITVADIGCGYGAATIQLAKAYPNSTLIGFDYHDTSIAAAAGPQKPVRTPTCPSRSPGPRTFPGRTT